MQNISEEIWLQLSSERLIRPNGLSSQGGTVDLDALLAAKDYEDPDIAQGRAVQALGGEPAENFTGDQQSSLPSTSRPVGGRPL